MITTTIESRVRFPSYVLRKLKHSLPKRGISVRVRISCQKISSSQLISTIIDNDWWSESYDDKSTYCHRPYCKRLITL